MEFKRIWTIYFSPTGTTKKVVSALSESISSHLPYEPFKDSYDFTLKPARSSFPNLSQEDLVIFGMPTYAGRLPNLMLKYLDTIQGNDATAVVVTTFGNRNFDNSLIELRDLLEDHGFHTVAAAACSCEHSFSYELGVGRPDSQDLEEITTFGKKVAEFLPQATTPVAVPGIPKEENHGGYYQPRDRQGVFIDIRKVKVLTDLAHCSNCLTCITSCPMGTADPFLPSDQQGVCIKCGACVKKCPTGSRFYGDPGYLYHKTELEEMYARRADNWFSL